MKTFKKEDSILDLVKNNKTNSEVTYLISNDLDRAVELVKACQGNACAFAALKDKDYKITDDIMPISSILVTDIWNANNDVFTAEEIIKAARTPEFKPINWMHRGSEDTENENIGVMVNAQLVSGELPEINYMSEEDAQEFDMGGNTLSGGVHIKQDGLVWSQYFPTYASKLKNGMENGNIYVSMECFFEDFGYCLRKDEDDTNPIFIDRTEATSRISKDLTAYGGSGTTKYKGKKYQVGRWLKNIIFSGQGIVFEPANKRKGKILSIIIKDENKTRAEIVGSDPAAVNPPTGPVQQPGTILNPQETTVNQSGSTPTLVSTPTELAREAELPKTYEEPQDGLLFYTGKEAEMVGKVELGCTGHHLYQQDRHGDKPLLYGKLMGDPSDLENQMKLGRYRPCDDERELRFILQDMAKKGIKLKRLGNLTPDQTTSFQPSVPGGDGEDIGSMTTIDPNTGQPGGTDMGQVPGQGQGQLVKNNSLDNKKEQVYETEGANKLSNINEEEIEQALDLAADKINELNSDNAEYEKAISEATKHIEKLNTELAELQAFAASVEKIADKAFENKIATARKKEMDELLGREFVDISAEDLGNMTERSYSILKASIMKIADSIDSKAQEIEKANAAAAAVRAVKKPVTSSMVVSSVKEQNKNTAESLIGFAFSKKR